MEPEVGAEHHVAAAVEAAVEAAVLEALRRPAGGKDGGPPEHWPAGQTGRHYPRTTEIRPLAVTSVRVVSRHSGTGCAAEGGSQPCSVC